MGDFLTSQRRSQRYTSLGICGGSIVTGMKGIIIGHFILAIPLGITATAALWRFVRVKSSTGHDGWSGRRDMGFGPQARRVDLWRLADRPAK
jgi:hypothetical protein